MQAPAPHGPGFSLQDPSVNAKALVGSHRCSCCRQTWNLEKLEIVLGVVVFDGTAPEKTGPKDRTKF